MGFGSVLPKHFTYAYLNAMLSLIIVEVSLFESWILWLECESLRCSAGSPQLWLSGGVGVGCPNDGPNQSSFGSAGLWSLVGSTVHMFSSPLFTFLSAGKGCDTAVTTGWGTGWDIIGILSAVNPLHWSGAWKRRETNKSLIQDFGFSQWCSHISKSSGMLCCVAGWAASDLPRCVVSTSSGLGSLSCP